MHEIPTPIEFSQDKNHDFDKDNHNLHENTKTFWLNQRQIGHQMATKWS